MAWLLVFTVVASTVLGDLLQSVEMKQHADVMAGRGMLARVAGQVFRRWRLIVAVGFMAVSFFAFLQLLTVADLSFAVPATAGSFVLETILARMVLKERVCMRRWSGVALVACGVALLAL